MNEPKYQQITDLITVLRTSNQGAFFRHFNDECKRTLSPQLGIQLFLELRSIFSNKTKRQIVSY